jgi:hypothetical protein
MSGLRDVGFSRLKTSPLSFKEALRKTIREDDRLHDDAARQRVPY